MSVRPSNIPTAQEMPPPGGYRPVDTIRKFPIRGPKGWQLWAGSTAFILYGFTRVGAYNKERAEQKYLERKARYAIAPVLQAEADKEYLERELVNLKKEAEIMQGVEGWTVGKNPFHSKKCMPRATDAFNTSLK
jgi:NADH dehydrogenase (ubiquinone) 1 alpha subcomplex subunit 13